MIVAYQRSQRHYVLFWDLYTYEYEPSMNNSGRYNYIRFLIKIFNELVKCLPAGSPQHYASASSEIPKMEVMGLIDVLLSIEDSVSQSN